LACNAENKLDVNDNSFAHLTLTLLLHYLVKCISRILAVYVNANSEQRMQTGIIASRQNHWKSVDYIVWSVLCKRVYLTNRKSDL